MELSDNEKALYVELAVRLAVSMGGGVKGSIVEHSHQSILQTGCEVLQRMGALQALKRDMTPWGDKRGFPHCYRLKFGASEFREFLAGTLPASAPSLSEVIEAFVGVVGGFYNGIPTRRDAFAVPPVFERAFDLFERFGYVERVGDKVKWTDNIAPEMRAGYVWNKDLVSHWEVCEAYEAEADELWQTMPRRLREALCSGGRVNIKALMIVISRFWNGREWVGVNPDGGTIEIGTEYLYLTGGEIRMAQYLEKKFRESRG